jgi:DNA gyrase subunit B
MTFFFRQMQQLFINDMIYIAQPPLYELKIKGKKKSEYIINENQMRKRMTNRGLDGTQLVIKEDSEERNIADKELANLVKALNDIERIVGVLSRRGINFLDFVKAYYDGKQLPKFRIKIQGSEELYYDKAEYQKRIEELKDQLGPQDTEEPSAIAEELHEVERINQINDKLKQNFNLDINDFLLKPQRTVSGEAIPTKFQLINDQEKIDVASLGKICSTIMQIGGKNIEIKRFKGLGEMNADQLWDTTMNPATRTLLQVKVDDAGEADRLFSILMGDDVEKRRNFIKEHALEVQNLDV